MEKYGYIRSFVTNSVRYSASKVWEVRARMKMTSLLSMRTDVSVGQNIGIEMNLNQWADSVHVHVYS